MENLKKKIISGTLLVTLLTYTMPILAFTNEETIYSKLDSNGKKYKTIVSTFTEDDEAIQEEIKKDLPIECKVKYELDGKEILPEELAGKSGKIKMILDYTNNEKNIVKINSKDETLYTPFLILSGTVIDNENNKNIQISNGRVINEGDKTIVVGFALPGMQESLDISKEDIDIPNKIEITMDSTNFEIGNIMSFATPQILEEGDLDNIFDKTDELVDQVNELQSASNELEEGTVKLKDGVVTLNDGAHTLNNGVHDLNNGAKDLNNGAEKLKNGTNQFASSLSSKMLQMASGTNELNTKYGQLDAGIKNMKAKLPELVAGAEKIEQGLTAENVGVIATMKSLNSALSAVSRLTPQVTNDSGSNEASQYINSAIDVVHSVNTVAPVNNITPELEAKKTELQNQINSLNEQKTILTAGEITPEIESAVNALNASIGILEASKGTLSVNVPESKPVDLSGVENNLLKAQASLSKENTVVSSQADTTAQMQNILNGYTKVTLAIENTVVPGVTAIKEGAGALNGGVIALDAGSDLVKAGISSLNDTVSSLTKDNSELSVAINTISKGASDLANGTGSLLDGSNKLSDGSNSLVNGTNTLLDGSNELADGAKKFNDEGVKKISSFVNGDLKNVITRAKKLEELSNDYNKFASEEEREAIKFISIIDSIKKSAKEESGEEAAILNNDKAKYEEE